MGGMLSDAMPSANIELDVEPAASGGLFRELHVCLWDRSVVCTSHAPQSPLDQFASHCGSRLAERDPGMENSPLLLLATSGWLTPKPKLKFGEHL